jgi:hypothetical protein
MCETREFTLWAKRRIISAFGKLRKATIAEVAQTALPHSFFLFPPGGNS